MDRAGRGERPGAVPKVLHDCILHDGLVIEPDPGAGPELTNLKRVPLAERLVGLDERIFTRRAGGVVPKATRAFVGTVFDGGLMVHIPDLHLGSAAQINAAVGGGHGLVVERELDIAVVLVRRCIGPVAVIDEFAVLNGPVFRELRLLIGKRLPALFGRGCLDGGVRVVAVPAGKIFAVKEGDRLALRREGESG